MAVSHVTLPAPPMLVLMVTRLHKNPAKIAKSGTMSCSRRNIRTIVVSGNPKV